MQERQELETETMQAMKRLTLELYSRPLLASERAPKLCDPARHQRRRPVVHPNLCLEQ